MSARLRNTISKVLPPLFAILLLVAVWQTVCSFGQVPKYMLPSPGDVAAAFEKDWQLMFSHAKTTMTETFIGLFFGILIGFLAARKSIFKNHQQRNGYFNAYYNQ